MLYNNWNGTGSVTKVMKQKFNKIPGPIRGIIALLFWVAVWWILSLAVGREVLIPTPLRVFKRLFELLRTADFYRIVGLSLLRILAGFSAAIVLGVLFGVLSAKLPPVDLLLSPLLSVIRATPVASFIILALVFLNKQLIPGAIAFLMVFPVMCGNIRTGILETDRGLLEMAQVFRLKRSAVLREIQLPAVRPYFIAAFRNALGMAWKAGVAAEVLCNPGYSIGRMLYESKIYLETPDLFAWTLTVIIMSVILEKLLLFFLNRTEKKRKGGENL